jgi:hypothetical protein
VNLIQVTTHYQGAPSRLFFLSSRVVKKRNAIKYAIKREEGVG